MLNTCKTAEETLGACSSNECTSRQKLHCCCTTKKEPIMQNPRKLEQNSTNQNPSRHLQLLWRCSLLLDTECPVYKRFTEVLMKRVKYFAQIACLLQCWDVTTRYVMHTSKASGKKNLQWFWSLVITVSICTPRTPRRVNKVRSRGTGEGAGGDGAQQQTF